MIKGIEQQGNKTIYNIRFINLTDLYEYLKSSPKVNVRVFSEQSSILKKASWAGESLNQSIEYLLGGYKKSLDNFLKASGKLQSIGNRENDESSRTLRRAFYGGIPLASLVASGIPESRLVYDRYEEVRYATIHFSLAYPAVTKEEQIINRGLATLYIVQSLESRGYIVNFKAFALVNCNDEIVNFAIDLKKPGEEFLNIEKCYFPMIAREFLRRIVFRVIESSDVTEREWNFSYGQTMAPSHVAHFLKTRPSDLIIPSPNEIEIEGINIYRDTLALIEYLGIKDEFDIPTLKKLIKNR